MYMCTHDIHSAHATCMYIYLKNTFRKVHVNTMVVVQVLRITLRGEYIYSKDLIVGCWVGRYYM